MMIYCRHMVI